MTDHLILRLEAPMLSFGGTAVDARRPTEDFPGKSLLTGLLGNALGYQRTDHQALQQLQARLVYAVRIDREPDGKIPLVDFQTARISSRDTGWTTWGLAERRRGAGQAFPLLRQPEYWVDALYTIALRLDPSGPRPNIYDLDHALRKPARPLYIGRKTCLPTRPLHGGFQKGRTALAALLNQPPVQANLQTTALRCQWPSGEGDDRVRPNQPAARQSSDTRNWRTRLHGGVSWNHQGTIPPDTLPGPEPSNHQPQPEAGNDRPASLRIRPEPKSGHPVKESKMRSPPTPDFTPIHLLQAEINLRNLYQWQAQRNLHDTGQALHCLLVETLGNNLAPKPFRLMRSHRDNNNATLYGYCQHPAAELQSAASSFASPQRERIMPPNSIATKVMRLDFPSNATLGFEIQVLPVLRQRYPTNKVSEIDAYDLHLGLGKQTTRQDHDDPTRPPEKELSRMDVYRNWLARAFANQGSATLLQAMPRAYHRVRAIRRQNGKTIDRPEVVFTGNIRDQPATVSQPGPPWHRTPPGLRLRHATAPSPGLSPNRQLPVPTEPEEHPPR